MQIFLSVNSYEPLPGGGCWWPAAAVVALINPPMDILLFTGAGTGTNPSAVTGDTDASQTTTNLLWLSCSVLGLKFSNAGYTCITEQMRDLEIDIIM